MSIRFTGNHENDITSSLLGNALAAKTPQTFFSISLRQTTPSQKGDGILFNSKPKGVHIVAHMTYYLYHTCSRDEEEMGFKVERKSEGTQIQNGQRLHREV